LVVARAERYFFKWIAGTPVSARREHGAGRSQGDKAKSTRHDDPQFS
jgi:hypothetical protein